MAWDATKPESTTKVKDSPTIFQGNWVALAAANDEQHQAIDSVLTPGAHLPGKCSVMFYGSPSAIDALTDVPCAVAFDTTNLDLCYNNGSAWVSGGGVIPVGTKMLFYQDTAPVGWLIDSTVDDKLVYITKGSGAGGQTGGGAHSTGSWTITGFASHTHTFTTGLATLNVSVQTYVSGTIAYGHLSTQPPVTGTNSDTTVSQDGLWRPAAYCCIICTKK